MSKTKIQDIKLIWDGEHPELDDLVKQDLKSLIGLRKPSDLITHSIFLGKDYDGPSVGVWGEEDSDAFHCRYYEKTEWKSLADLENEDIDTSKHTS